MVSYHQYPPQEPSQNGSMPPMQQPVQQTMPQYYPKIKIEIAELFNDSIVILSIFISLFLMWIHLLLLLKNLNFSYA